MSDIISASFRIATPFLLAAIGGLLCFRAGVFNIGLEGLMLTGSFAGVVGVMISQGNVYIGLLTAIVAGVALAAVFALATEKFHANPIIVGLAINLLSLGMTAFLLKAVFKTTGALRPAVMNKLSDIAIPLIGKQSIITFFAIFSVLVVMFVMSKTHIGIKIQSVGESPNAAATSGIHVTRIRVIMILLSGAFCGLAGAYLSTVVVSEFTENMVAGRGFTAFTAVAFGNANPIATLLVSLLLGFADAMGIRIEISNIGISPSVVKMFPYLLALAVYVIGTALRTARIRRKI